ncbi:SPOR domain-containing protein [Sediminitomix flava]|uniref:Sporulation related protein n=1 Tax=Sediminitomix flava TaxID=379075 RepID=A0A315ZJX8_SEDFL|nr:SPOR domain-containing protein [Sediminitomix flava]PWJ34221.1 sporulation related protein [Sediminitomix flava]
MKKTFILTAAILMAFVSCKTSKTASTSFDADLSAYRSEIVAASATKEEEKPEEEATEPVNSSDIPEGEMHEQIESMIGQMAQRNYSKVEGYRILIYSTTSRSMANKAYNKAKAIYHEPVYFNYEQPNYKISLGDYYSKRLAHEKLSMLKADYPKAIIVRDYIKVSEYSVLNLTPDTLRITPEEYEKLLLEDIEEENLPEVTPESE